MRYRQLDKITELVPGSKLVATRTLQADEDYLLDHFPRFPVMPGVMMLETLVQAGGWLIRCSEDFEHSTVLLKQARAVKFNSFVTPGQTLEVSVTAQKLSGSEYRWRCSMS